MAQFTDPIAGYAVAANPVGAGFTRRSSGPAHASSSIVSGATPVGTQFWRLTSASGEINHYSWDTPGTSTAWNVLVIVRRSAADQIGAMVQLLATGEGYWGGLRNNDVDSRIAHMSAALGQTSLATGAHGIVSPTSKWVGVRVDRSGTTLRARSWDYDAEAEPGTWDVSTTDSTIAGVGYSGFFYWSLVAGGNTFDLAYLSAGTAGDIAPSPAAGGETKSGATQSSAGTAGAPSGIKTAALAALSPTAAAGAPQGSKTAAGSSQAVARPISAPTGVAQEIRSGATRSDASASTSPAGAKATSGGVQEAAASSSASTGSKQTAGESVTRSIAWSTAPAGSSQEVRSGATQTSSAVWSSGPAGAKVGSGSSSTRPELASAGAGLKIAAGTVVVITGTVAQSASRKLSGGSVYSAAGVQALPISHTPSIDPENRFDFVALVRALEFVATERTLEFS